MENKARTCSSETLIGKIHYIIHEASYAFKIGEQEAGQKLLAKANQLANASFPSMAIEGKEAKLDIALFSKLSAERAETGFKTYRNVPITYWTTALMGEGGELCNMVKKMERVAHGGIDGGSTYTAASLSKEDLAEEIGGIFIYLNLLSGLLGIDMEDAIIETFNSKSKKYGFPQFYPSPPTPPAGEERAADRMTEGAKIGFSRRDDEERPNYESEDEDDIWDAVRKYRDAHPEPQEDESWERRKIDRLCDVIGISEDQIRELEDEVKAQKAKQRELVAELQKQLAEEKSFHAYWRAIADQYEADKKELEAKVRDLQDWIHSHC